MKKTPCMCAIILSVLLWGMSIRIIKTFVDLVDLRVEVANACIGCERIVINGG